MAAKANESAENIGARRLQTVLAALLEPYLFEVPDSYAEDRIDIDVDTVRERLHGILSDEDLRRYML